MAIAPLVVISREDSASFRYLVRFFEFDYSNSGNGTRARPMSNRRIPKGETEALRRFFVHRCWLKRVERSRLRFDSEPSPGLPTDFAEDPRSKVSKNESLVTQGNEKNGRVTCVRFGFRWRLRQWSQQRRVSGRRPHLVRSSFSVTAYRTPGTSGPERMRRVEG